MVKTKSPNLGLRDILSTSRSVLIVLSYVPFELVLERSFSGLWERVFVILLKMSHSPQTNDLDQRQCTHLTI
jgi:hypothetical protein